MKIEGTKEACSFLAAYPRETRKIISKALRESVKPMTRRLYGYIPVARWKRLVKVKVKQSKSTSRLYAKVGMFDDGKATRGGASDWFQAYWLNYGTLRRRDPGHKFDYPPRGNKSRNKQGIYQRNFYDYAMQGMDNDLTNRFLKSIEQQHERLINSKLK